MIMLVLFTAGCSPQYSETIPTYSKYPHASIFPASSQQKMQAAHHWDVLAGVEAENILQRLENKIGPLYVEPVQDDFYLENDLYYHKKQSDFNHAFHDFLLSRLSRQDLFTVWIRPLTAVLP